MAFRFPLATLLRVRTIQEEREERMLQQILAEIAQTTAAQAEVDAAIERLGASRHEEFAMEATGSDVHSHYGELAGLHERKAELQAHQDKLAALRDKQMKVYEAAHGDRELLAGLGDAQRAAYRSDLAKREQKMLDDNFAARRRRA